MGSIRHVVHKRAIKLFIHVLIVFCMLTLTDTTAWGEALRGTVSQVLKLDEQYAPISAVIGLRELTGLDFSADEYLRGIVLEIDTPNTVLQFRESFMLSFYGSISPPVSSGTTSFNGQKLYSKAFPQNRRTFVDLKLDPDSPWEPSSLNSITLSPSPDKNAYPLLFSIVPVMKGIPSHISKSTFKVTLTPVLKNIGALDVHFTPQTDLSGIELYIDSRQIPVLSDPVYLPPGVHNIEVRSQAYMPYSQSFGIEQAQTTKLEITLQPAKSFVQFDAPEDAVIFLDGQQIEGNKQNPVETDPGEHVVLVRIGDYSVSKKIDIQGGKNYKVSLFFDILVNDN